MKQFLKSGGFAFILIILFFGNVNSEVFAQHTPEYSKHYSFEQVINPAITGRDRYPFLNLSNKKYWLNTQNSPFEICLGGSFRLGNFNFYTPSMMLNKENVFAKDRMGFGGFLMYEQNGPLGYFFAEFDYAYHLPLNKNATSELSFGLSLQLSDYNINTSLFDPLDPGDPELLSLDKVPSVWDGGFGIYYNTEQFFAGISVNDLLKQESQLETEIVNPNQRDYFMQTGYKFYLLRFELEPSVLAAQIDDDPMYYFGQIKAYYSNYNWFSVGYMSTKSVRLAVGLRVRRMHVVYAFEQSVSKMANYFSNSHEIMLGINIGLFKSEGIRKTVNRRP